MSFKWWGGFFRCNSHFDSFRFGIGFIFILYLFCFCYPLTYGCGGSQGWFSELSTCSQVLLLSACVSTVLYRIHQMPKVTHNTMLESYNEDHTLRVYELLGVILCLLFFQYLVYNYCLAFVPYSSFFLATSYLTFPNGYDTKRARYSYYRAELPKNLI